MEDQDKMPVMAENKDPMAVDEDIKDDKHYAQSSHNNFNLSDIDGDGNPLLQPFREEVLVSHCI
jgi:hypothetical protein